MRYSLLEDIQITKNTLDEFFDVTIRILGHMSNVVDNQIEYKGYLLLSSTTVGQIRQVRPINKNLFLDSPEVFRASYLRFQKILKSLKYGERDFTKEEYKLLDSVVYTLQQSIGIGFDLLGESNSARKHVGNRFEDLVRIIVTELGITNRKMILKIPYSINEAYRSETDMVISPNNLKTTNIKTISKEEIVISLKTTSKDRMSKIFIDKLLMEKFLKHKVKVVGIFLNDVQRKNPDRISFTLVSNLFLVYSKFLTKLQGVYFIDPPPRTNEKAFKKYIQPFSKFIIEDIWKLVNP